MHSVYKAEGLGTGTRCYTLNDGTESGNEVLAFIWPDVPCPVNDAVFQRCDLAYVLRAIPMDWYSLWRRSGEESISGEAGALAARDSGGTASRGGSNSYLYQPDQPEWVSTTTGRMR